MSRQELREQLARLAEDAPVASVPDDTYRRGRRARARVRAAAAALAAGCVALITVIGMQAIGDRPSANEFAGTSGSTPGIPDRLYLDNRTRVRLTPLNALPQLVAVAFVAAQNAEGGGVNTVLVDPEGQYFDVRLPGYQAFDQLSLSPDGTRLSWAWHGGSGATGLAVMSLTTGKISVEGARAFGQSHGMLIQRITWSPDSRIVLWSGNPVAQSRRTDWGGADIGGMMSVDPVQIITPLPAGVTWSTRQPCDNGTAVTFGTEPDAWRNGRRLSKADLRTLDQTACAHDMGAVSDSTESVAWLGVRADGSAVEVRHRFPTWTGEEIWAGGRAVSVLPGDFERLSVATSLMGADQPSHGVARPSWAPKPTAHHHTRVLALGATGALVLATSAFWWRRRRRLTHM